MTELASAYPPSVQAGIPKLGRLPRGWSRVALGELLRPVYRPVEMKDDEVYQLVTAKRSRGGIVARERLPGRDIKVKDQYQVRAGDFILSNRQISHGGVGLVPPELDGAIVSGEYTVLEAFGPITLNFLNAFSHSVYFQQICFHSSIGVHVEKLVFRLEDWLRWEVDLPPMDDQERICEALSSWDQALGRAEVLFAAKRRELSLVIQSMSRTWSTIPLDQFGKWVGGGTPSKANEAFWTNGVIPWASPKDMSRWRISKTQDHITEEALRSSSTALVPAGSVLIVTRSGILRSLVPVAVTMTQMAINQDLKAILPEHPQRAELLCLLLRNSSDRLRQATMKTGTTVESLDTEALRAFELPFPDGSEEVVATELLVGMADALDQLRSWTDALQRQRRGLIVQLLCGQKRLRESRRTGAAA